MGLRLRKKTNRVIFHHALADTCSIADIRKWHTYPKPEGRGWLEVGYHFLVRKSGEVVPGRDVRLVGAHAFGRNGVSVGICLEGNFHGEEPSIVQIEAAGGIYHSLCRQYSKSLKVGFHRPNLLNLFEPSGWGRFNSCPGRLLDRLDFLEQMAKYNPFVLGE